MVSKILLIFTKKVITSIYYIRSLYVFIIYLIKLASLKKKRFKII